MRSLLDRINPGDRPSRLDLGRLLTGEAEGEEARRLRGALEENEEAVAWTEAVASCRTALPPFDPEALRRRAQALAREDEHAENELLHANAGQGIPWWRALFSRARLLYAGAVLVSVAGLALFLRPPEEGTGPGIRARGRPDIDFVLLRDGQLLPGDEQALHRAGDRVQVSYRSVGEQSLVLLSVDGRGRVSLYYPKEGTRPLTIEPGERHLLPESIELDDAPDFELFLAYFGADDAAVPLREVEAIFANDGLDGLLRMVEASPDMDAILLRKEKAGGR